MVFITMSYPVILLSLACLGYGICGMALLWKERRRLPIAFRLLLHISWANPCSRGFLSFSRCAEYSRLQQCSAR